MAGSKVLVYLLRRDLRAADNPILHHLATTNHGFTYLLPVFVLPPNQIEVSGFLGEGEKSPYPPALSHVGKFWRCGPNRARFLAQSIWDLKKSLQALDSGLVVRVGSFADVVAGIIDSLKGSHHSLGAVWMTEEMSFEEVQDQNAISDVCSANGVDLKLWPDEKYFIDDRDTGLRNPQELPDIFTSYRKTREPLRLRPRRSVPRPALGSLPPFPLATWIPAQKGPFIEASDYDEFVQRLLEPVQDMLPNPTAMPHDAKSGHPFKGGEMNGWKRVFHLVKTGGMVHYQETRNGLIGVDYSTKLSGYLALGCITARQIHEELMKLEDGLDPLYAMSVGFNRGENEGTKAVRFELLWRDYMRLCTMKFGHRLFTLSGFKGETDDYDKKWVTADEQKADPNQNPPPQQIKSIIDRFLEGRTGMGLIDASQREVYHTGYTSNRARQNVASFFAKHLSIDWRYGAEWYEAMLIDYDVSSNWANWQYVAGVGNDPRGDARIFNPVKQAFDYDNNGAYVRTWVPEVKYIENLENVFQVWTTDEEELEKYGLIGDVMVTDPIKKIDFLVDRKPRGPRRPFRGRRRGGVRGGHRGGSSMSGSGPSTDGSPHQHDARKSFDGDASNHGNHWVGNPNNGNGPHVPHGTGNWNTAPRGRANWRGGRGVPGPGRNGPGWGYSHVPYDPQPQFVHHPVAVAVVSHPHPAHHPPPPQLYPQYPYAPHGYHHHSHMGPPV